MISNPPTSNVPARTKPYTSEEYLESLRDGREIWIYGERVKDVTTHPAFRNTVRMLGRLYDALHDERKNVLCTPTDTGSGATRIISLKRLAMQKRWLLHAMPSRNGLV